MKFARLQLKNKLKFSMSTWDPERDVELTDSEDEIAMKRDFHGREAILFVVDANLEVNGNTVKEICMLNINFIDRALHGRT